MIREDVKLTKNVVVKTQFDHLQQCDRISQRPQSHATTSLWLNLIMTIMDHLLQTFSENIPRPQASFGYFSPALNFELEFPWQQLSSFFPQPA